MHRGARQLPVHHLSVRLPWHDTGWTGTVCLFNLNRATVAPIRTHGIFGNIDDFPSTFQDFDGGGRRVGKRDEVAGVGEYVGLVARKGALFLGGLPPQHFDGVLRTPLA